MLGKKLRLKGNQKVVKSDMYFVNALTALVANESITALIQNQN